MRKQEQAGQDTSVQSSMPQMVTTAHHCIDISSITSMRVLEETDKHPRRLRVNTEHDLHIIEGREAVVFAKRLRAVTQKCGFSHALFAPHLKYMIAALQPGKQEQDAVTATRIESVTRAESLRDRVRLAWQRIRSAYSLLRHGAVTEVTRDPNIQFHEDD